MDFLKYMYDKNHTFTQCYDLFNLIVGLLSARSSYIIDDNDKACLKLITTELYGPDAECIEPGDLGEWEFMINPLDAGPVMVYNVRVD